MKYLNALFKIFGIWLQASKQANKHTHTHVQCSPASVGFTQARPNYLMPYGTPNVTKISCLCRLDRSSFSRPCRDVWIKARSRERILAFSRTFQLSIPGTISRTFQGSIPRTFSRTFQGSILGTIRPFLPSVFDCLQCAKWRRENESCA